MAAQQPQPCQAWASPFCLLCQAVPSSPGCWAMWEVKRCPRKDVHVLSPATCECYLYGTDFADVIKLRILR